MKKIIVSVVMTAVVAGAIGFFGGMTYSRQSVSQVRGGARQANFQNLSPEERQQMSTQGGFGGSAGRRGGISGGGIAAGEVLSLDAKSITVKLRDGGSKIVFVSSSTAIMKSVTGSLADLLSGEQVVVMGSANSDGSLTAQSVQIRPAIQK